MYYYTSRNVKKKYVREGFKKIIMKIPFRWVGGVGMEKFSINFFFEKKNIYLKHLNYLKITLKQTYFFSIFGGGDPPPVRSWSDGRLELQTSLEKLSETSQITRIKQNSFHGM